MRLGVYPIVFALLFTGLSYAQERPWLGEIAPPVIEGEIVPDSSEPSTVAQTEETREELKTPKIEMREDPFSLELGSSIGLPQADYRTLEITEPINNASIKIRTSNLHIKSRVVPPVKNELGHVLQIMVGEEILAENQIAYTVDALEKGTHSLQLRIIDENDNILKQSDAVTILVQ